MRFFFSEIGYVQAKLKSCQLYVCGFQIHTNLLFMKHEREMDNHERGPLPSVPGTSPHADPSPSYPPPPTLGK